MRRQTEPCLAPALASGGQRGTGIEALPVDLGLSAYLEKHSISNTRGWSQNPWSRDQRQGMWRADDRISWMERRCYPLPMERCNDTIKTLNVPVVPDGLHRRLGHDFL